MVKRFGGFCDDMREAVMNKEELQVLRALEMALDMAEAELAWAECDGMPTPNPSEALAAARVQQIKDAIEVVMKWKSDE